MIIKNILSKIYIHPSCYFLIVLAFISGYFSLITMISILLLIHECGHFFTAYFLNWEVDRIVFYPYGGISKFNHEVNCPLKEELIIKIVTNREWPKKDIYNKTLLSLAFYGLNKAYRFFLNNPNVYINTLTLELIHEYSRKFYKEAYHDEDYKIEKNDEQKKDIEEVTMQLLMTRQDLISEEEKLPYDLLIFDMMASTSEFTDNIIEKFYDKELANKIAMDSWWNLRKETGIKIRPHINLPSYIIDHIDKFILQDNEKNKELYVWAKKYTDRLVKEALYLKEHDESGKVKVNTKLFNSM